MDVDPERISAVDERVVEIVGDLPSPFPRLHERLGAHAGREALDVDSWRIRLPDCLLHDVLELTHVTWPAVLLEDVEGLRRERHGAPPDRRKVLDQRAHVAAPLAERRDMNVDHAEPIQQVFPELPGGNAL